MHCCAPGTQMPVHIALAHANGHASVTCHVPFASHVWTTVPSQRTSLGEHCMQDPSRHSGELPEQAAPDCHDPAPSHTCGTSPTHCFDVGTQMPVHNPLAHPKPHAIVSCQTPLSSHFCAVLPSHCTDDGEHSAHAPLKQTGVVPEQGTPYSQFPVLSHVRGVFAPHSLAPGEQATQTLSKQAGVAPPQGSLASTQTPATHVRGVWPSQPVVPSMQPASIPASISLPPDPPTPPCPPVAASDSASFPASFASFCPTRIISLSLSQAAKIPMGRMPIGNKISTLLRIRRMIVILQSESPDLATVEMERKGQHSTDTIRGLLVNA